MIEEIIDEVRPAPAIRSDGRLLRLRDPIDRTIVDQVECPRGLHNGHQVGRIDELFRRAGWRLRAEHIVGLRAVTHDVVSCLGCVSAHLVLAPPQARSSVLRRLNSVHVVLRVPLARRLRGRNDARRRYCRQVRQLALAVNVRDDRRIELGERGNFGAAMRAQNAHPHRAAVCRVRAVLLHPQIDASLPHPNRVVDHEHHRGIREAVPTRGREAVDHRAFRERRDVHLRADHSIVRVDNDTLHERVLRHLELLRHHRLDDVRNRLGFRQTQCAHAPLRVGRHDAVGRHDVGFTERLGVLELRLVLLETVAHALVDDLRDSRRRRRVVGHGLAARSHVERADRRVEEHLRALPREQIDDLLEIMRDVDLVAIDRVHRRALTDVHVAPLPARRVLGADEV